MGDRTHAANENARANPDQDPNGSPEGKSIVSYQKYFKGGEGSDKDDVDMANGCVFRDTDRPSRPLTIPPETWTFEWISIGVIIDTCRGVIVRYKWLTWEDSGTVDASGNVTYDAPTGNSDQGPKKSEGYVNK